MTRLRLMLVVCALGLPATARAQQFRLVDITYEHLASYNSHYRIKNSAETPANWTSPIDYTKGRVYGHIEFIQRPSTTQAMFGICMEATPTYACTFSPTYGTRKVADWNQPFTEMYQASQV